jgi:DNA-binding beta-propeller fold protein YncE
VEVRQGLNRLLVSPDQRWAVLWADEDGDAGAAVVSYNELSVVELATGQHFGLAVGEYPQAVAFTADGGTAVVLSERWLAVLELGGAGVNAQLLPLGEDLSAIAPAEEFLLDPQGRYALVRQLGVESLLRVSLPSGDRLALAVGQTPTDMDLSPDGRSLVVVARGSTEVWVLDAEDPARVLRVVGFPDATPFGGLTFADHGGVAVLSTNASLVPQVALWYTDTDRFEQLPLPKPVQTVLVSPGGTAVTVLHTVEDAPDADRSSPFFGQDALSLIDLDGSLLVNSLVLDSPVLAHALSPTGAFGYVVLAGGGQLVQLDYTPDPPTLQTITGFELNSGIERDE